MHAIEKHMGPLELDGGVVSSTPLADRIFRETGVRASYRWRKQNGKNRKLTILGPVDRLDRALELVNRYGRNPEMTQQVERYKALNEEEKCVSVRSGTCPKGGQMRKIQAESKYRIMISQLEDELHTREVAITGPKEGIEIARKIIEAMMAADTGGPRHTNRDVRGVMAPEACGLWVCA